MQRNSPVRTCGAPVTARLAATLLAALREATDGGGPFAVELRQDEDAASLRLDVHYDGSALRPRPDAERIVAHLVEEGAGAALAVRWVDVRPKPACDQV